MRKQIEALRTFKIQLNVPHDMEIETNYPQQGKHAFEERAVKNGHWNSLLKGTKGRNKF